MREAGKKEEAWSGLRGTRKAVEGEEELGGQRRGKTSGMQGRGGGKM